MPSTEIFREEAPVPSGAKNTLGGVSLAGPADEEAYTVNEPVKAFSLAKSISVESVPPGGAVSVAFTTETLKSGPVTVILVYVV